MTDDAVINPNYYKGTVHIPKELLPSYLNEEGDLSLQYMQLMELTMTREELVGHLKGQVFKYLLRLGKKDSWEQDSKKANWYASYLADFLEREARVVRNTKAE